MSRPSPHFPLAACGFLLAACAEAEPPSEAHQAAPAQNPVPEHSMLVDQAQARGVEYLNRSGSPEKATILEANGAGVALIDLDSDRDLDLVFAQGLDSLEQLQNGPGADLEIFVNDGAGQFSRREGPGLNGWWTGLAVGDVNNDGRDDLVAAGFGSLALLLQDSQGELNVANGSGLDPERGEAFTPGAERAENSTAPSWATSLALFDANLDGVLDLYVGRYLEFDPYNPPIDTLGEGDLALPCRFKGHTVFCGPHGLKPQADLLYLGSGAGKFERAPQEFMQLDHAGYTLGVAAFDIEGDGDTDLMVAVDSNANRLWVNQNGTKLLDRAREAGVALSQDGRPEAGMGVAFGDVNLDGKNDFAITNFSGEPTELYFGTGSGFEQRTFQIGLSRATRRLLSWGTHLVDFDADGAAELFTANGHVYPQADLDYTGTSYGQRDTIWSLRRTDGNFTLEEWSSDGEGNLLAAELGSRGSAVGDLDGNGAPDLVVTRIDANAALGMNFTGADQNRLTIRLVGAPEKEGPAGRRTPRDAHGTRVAVVLAGGETALLGEVQSAVGYQSSSSAPLYFGLGESSRFESLRVYWPSGLEQDFKGGAANRTLTITEGTSAVESEDYR